ncbi:MAG TPA: transcription-repair coupling factor, partial [Rhodobacter sp.]|nr:transcription-repair coupling factor [Rhodobacter sp.]
MKNAHKILLGGAPEGYDAYLLLQELAKGQPIIHIARDDKRMSAMRASLMVLKPDSVVIVFPAWDCLPYDRVSPNPEISAQRMASLAWLATQDQTTGPFIVLTTVGAATQKLPALEVIKTTSFRADVGTRINESKLKAFLNNMGFSPVTTVREPGEYALRGGIVDIFPPGDTGPVRLDFFGDVLDGARRFDPDSQRTIEKLNSVDFAPVSEVILDENAITRFRQNYRIEFGTAGSNDPLYEAVSAGRKHQGMEHWLGFFHEKLESLFDYIPKATVMLDDQTQAMRLARWASIADQYDARKEALGAKGRLDSVYKPSSPELLYLDDAAFEGAISDRRVIQFSPSPQPPGPNVLDAEGRMGRNFSSERQQESISLFSALHDHIKALRRNNQVVIASWSHGARERLFGLIKDQGINDAVALDDLRTLPLGKGGLFLVLWPLDQGFIAPGFAVLSEQDILGDRLISKPRKKRKAENFINEINALSVGDLVVHVEHGVGRYNGLQTITALGAPHDCLSLEYADNARLYLPVENIELLSRYGHEEGLLDRLGSGAWQAKKARLKARIREIAEKLMRIAAERHLRHAPVLEAPDAMWEAFAARFPYQETDDQLSAIQDVISDLEAGRPMDRLVVGDVGFGKTE